MAETTQIYEGQDLEALADLPNYHAWAMRWFEPYLSGRVIEYGAGTGTLSTYVRPKAQHLTLVEPSSNLIPALASKFRADPSVEAIARSLEEHADRQSSNTAEAIVLVNVLEHIEDNLRALQHFSRIIVKGGHPSCPHLRSPAAFAPESS
jgi:ubiquinone/menaquinone biosynthesis C-methylase UbiE